MAAARQVNNVTHVLLKVNFRALPYSLIDTQTHMLTHARANTQICGYMCLCAFLLVDTCVLYNKGVGSGFRDVYNSYRIMIKRLLPK